MYSTYRLTLSTSSRQRMLDLFANTQQNETPGTTKDLCLFFVSRYSRNPAAAYLWRKAVMGTTLIGLFLGTVAGWVYLATLTSNENVSKLTSGLDAWDQPELK